MSTEKHRPTPEEIESADPSFGISDDEKKRAEFIVDFPEGGLRAWLTMAGAWGVMFISFGMTQAFGVFQDYYTRVLLPDFTPSQIAWIGSLQLCLLYGLGIFTGLLFDKGYFNHMLIPGSVIYLVSFFMISLCKPNKYYQFILAQGLGMGLGMGLMAVPSISIISHYFQKRRALASGIVFSGTSLAGVLWPIIFNHLFNSRIGFVWGVRVGAFIATAMLVLANLVMKPRLSLQEHRDKSPKNNLQVILRDWNWGICLFGTFVILLGLGFPFTYLQLYANLHGVPSNISENIIAIMFASGTLFGRMLPGYLADKFGILNLILLYTVAGGGIMFALHGASSTAGVIIFAIFYGPCGGAFNSLFAASVGSYAGSVSEYGLRIGLSGVIFGVGYLVGSPISGALLKPPKYEWTASINFSGATILAGCAIIFISRQILVAKKGKQRV